MSHSAPPPHILSQDGPSLSCSAALYRSLAECCCWYDAGYAGMPSPHYS